MRLMFDNAADRATVSSSTTAGQLVAASMQTEQKGVAHRSTGTAVVHTLTWGENEAIGGVALPASNLGPSATIRVRGYDDGGLQVVDTGEVWAAPSAGFDLLDWTGRMGAHVWNPDPSRPVTANLFACGFASKTAVWFGEHHSLRRLEVMLSDPENPAGFIDTARVLAGRCWSPEINPDWGLQTELVSMSTRTRAASGDLRADTAPQFDRMAFQLSWLGPLDCARMLEILRDGRNVFVDLLPNEADPRARQAHMIYGHLGGGPLVMASVASSTLQVEIEGW